MASLDVESLFTNVPVNETIDIILDYVYRNIDPEKYPPNIPENYMKSLLLLCTTECPFYSPDRSVFKQIDGVSMGCVLGPTMANFYMGHLEELALTDDIKPKTYTRFVDDIFVAIENEQQLLNIRDKFE
jgi:hypothetical protein